jgi:pyridoxal biosynthesis lyase PdxS
MDAVTIPVMAKCRIGHFAEAQILESLGVDMVDESEGKLFIVSINKFVCSLVFY